MHLPCGFFGPIHFLLRWRVHATAGCPLPQLRLYYQEVRTLRITHQHHRHYPTGQWLPVPAEFLHLRAAERSACGGYLYSLLDVLCRPALESPHPLLECADFPPAPLLFQLPVDDIVERHYEAKGGRSRSVLTFGSK